MRRLGLLLLVATAAAALLADVTSAAPIYRWRDAAGGVHFSNRPETVPALARELELAPVRASATPSRTAARAAVTVRRPEYDGRLRPARECGPGDPSGVADAVVSRLAPTRPVENLAVFVAGVPVMYRPGTVVTFGVEDVSDEPSAPLEQASIAYPGGAVCPERPPLVRYAVSSGRRSVSSGLCDDYRRAFAEVGLAASRDQRIARVFDGFAEDFSTIAARGYTARWTVPPVLDARAWDVRIPPWVVEAHIAQTAELGDETTDFVQKLTVALDEIQRAAHALGCW